MTEPDLSILCITRADPRCVPLLQAMGSLARGLDAQLVVGIDRGPDISIRGAETWPIESAGYLESVLDEMLEHCHGTYILRLDDDERVPKELHHWLAAGRYRTADNWTFPRRNLWADERHYILTHPLWPDRQTRLGTKARSGNRREIHQLNRFPSQVCPHPIEHLKCLLFSREEREAQAARYESLQPGAGTGHFLKFQVPEVMGKLTLGEL